MSDALLAVEGLSAMIGERAVLLDVSFSVRRGSTFALIGESGSGKTVTSRILTGLFDRIGGVVTAGSASFDGVDLTRATPETWRRLRGRRMALVPQASLSSLDPIMRIGRQLEETIAVLDPTIDRRARAFELLEQVRLPHPEKILRAFPHQLSGGMRQRIMIALALAGRPELLIADEPTTALDATVQKEILALMLQLREEARLTLVLIAHDLGVVQMIADDVAVMRAGKTVEVGPVARVLSAPAHPYTQELLARHDSGKRTAGAIGREGGGTPLLVAERVGITYPQASAPALLPTDLVVGPGAAIGIIGESGSGKSSFGRALVGAMRPTTGAVRLEGSGWETMGAADPRRRSVQMIFQDPYAALPTWRTPHQIVADVVRRWSGVSRRDALDRAGALLGEMGLPTDVHDRLPGLLSGGQCQRVGIARALACEPKVLVGDEPTASLDLATQGQIVDLLERLRTDRGLALVLISHDLALVRRLTDEVLVLRAGEVVERGPTADVLSRPAHSYTQALVAAMPRLHASPEESRSC